MKIGKLNSMRNILILCLPILLGGCTKKNRTFNLKTIKLLEYRHASLPDQKLYLEVYGPQSTGAIARTELYPGDFPLPAVFRPGGVPAMSLYKDVYTIRLLGTSSGYIGACRIDMKKYKIIFPIEMELEAEGVRMTIGGTWQ